MKKKEESNVEEQGSVLVRVYTSRAQIPVPVTFRLASSTFFRSKLI